MRPQRERRKRTPFLLNSIDCRGRLIAPAVLSVATEIGPDALQYADKLLVDPAVAISVFEEAAATVTQVVEAKILAGEPEVEDLPAYLFCAFTRLVKRQPQPTLSFEEAFGKESEPAVDGTERLHAALLLNRVLEEFEPVGRHIVRRRLEGFALDEIACELQISSVAVRVRLSRALERARRALNIQKPKRGGMNHAAIQKKAKTHTKKSLLRADFSSAWEDDCCPDVQTLNEEDTPLTVRLATGPFRPHPSRTDVEEDVSQSFNTTTPSLNSKKSA